MKGFYLVALMGLILNLFNVTFASTRNYDYVYEAPKKPSLWTNGLYVGISGGCIYAPSPSKLKNKSHRARTAANNRQYSNYQ